MALTLAQITGPEEGAIPDLPAAPLHETLLFETPVFVSGGVVLAAVLLAVVLLSRGKAKAGLVIGAIGVLAAAGLIGVSQVVETPRERLITLTAALVEASAQADAEGMREVLHPTARIGLDRTVPKWIPRRDIGDRESIIRRVESLADPAIGRLVILETRAGLDGPRVARTQVRLRALGPDEQMLGHSWWGLNWQLIDDRWQVVVIEPLWLQGFS